MNKKKICPLIRQACINTNCNLYSANLDRCDISLLAYNLYRLSEVEAQRIHMRSDETALSPSIEEDQIDLKPIPLDGLV